ncbi:MAG: glycosyltransferase family 2 protein [Dongiaceae bacterium]
MSQAPLISFVTTIYNKERYLPPVLAAIAGQKGDFSREFIFVNDGSTDGSLALLQELTRDWENSYIIDQPNKGPAIATNVGLAAAKGQFVKFVDGDDILDLNATAALLQAIQNGDAGVVVGNHANYQMDGGDIRYLPPHELEPYKHVTPDPLKAFIERCYFNLTPTLMPAALAKAVGGCDEKVFVQDYSIALRLARVAKFKEIPDIIFYGPPNEPGRLNNDQTQTLHDLNAALAYFLIDHPDLPFKYRNAALRRGLGRALKYAKREGAGVSFDLARDYILAQLYLYPGSAGFCLKRHLTVFGPNLR